MEIYLTHCNIDIAHDYELGRISNRYLIGKNTLIRGSVVQMLKYFRDNSDKESADCYRQYEYKES
jgi:hypothetical protein